MTTILMDGFGKDSAMTTGLLRQGMSEDLRETLTGIVYNNQHRSDPYWILAHTKPMPTDPTIIKTTLSLTSQCPYKMLGTICFYVNNKKGMMKRLWVLPLDAPNMSEGEIVPEVAEAAKGMPLIH